MAMVNSAEYCAFRASFEKLVTAIKNSVEKVARKAFEKNLITDQNLHIAGIQSIDNEHRASILLQQILSKIENKPANFDTFVGILESEPVLKDVACELKTKASELKQENFDSKPGQDTCDRGLAKKESVDSADSQFSFPSIVLQSISADERLRLESRLYYESIKMEERFANLYSLTFMSLKERNIPPLEVVNVLVGYSLREPVVINSDQPSFRKQLSKLRQAETVDVMMDIIIDYCSFFNFRIIECLISKLGSDKDKKALQKYKDEFTEYAKRKVYEMPSKVCPESENCRALVYVTLDKSFNQFTVNELLFFQGKLCEVLEVSPNSLQLCHIKPGSLKLIFQVPSFAEPPVFPLSQDKEAALAKLGVTYLSYSLVYQFSCTESIKFQQEYFMKESKKVEKQEEKNDPTQELSLKEDQIRQLSETVAEQKREIAKMNQKFFEMKTNAHLQEKTLKSQLDDAVKEANKMREELSFKEEQMRQCLERIAEQERKKETPHSHVSEVPMEYLLKPTAMTLHWKTAASAPREMTRTVDAAVDGDTVYIRPNGAQNVLAYNSTNDTWSQLPDCPTKDCSIAVVNNMLTTIGGRINRKATNRLFSFVGEGDGKRWEERFPPMLSEQRHTRAVCSETHLIVGGRYSPTIEVMNTTSLQWSRVADLPHHWSSLYSLVVCGEYLYSVHEGSIFRCSTLDLGLSIQEKETEIWSELECTDILQNSTYVSIRGQQLLGSVGGRSSRDLKPTTAVRVYIPTTKKWKVIGRMETPRKHCLAAVLPNNRLIVVGGYTTESIMNKTTKVEIATIV